MRLHVLKTSTTGGRAEGIGGRRRLRRLTPPLAVLAAVAAAALIWGSASSGAGPHTPPPGASARAGHTGHITTGHITTTTLGHFKAAVVARLHVQNLDFHWVICVPTSHRFRNVRVVRCNVDFGEPHIVAYCSVLDNGRLLTAQEDPAIPCGHDNAGWSDPIVTYN